MDRTSGAFFFFSLFLCFLLTPYTAENDVHLVSCLCLVRNYHFSCFEIGYSNILMLVFMQVGKFIQLAVGESRFALGRDLCISTPEYGPDLCTSYFILKLGISYISYPTGTQKTSGTSYSLDVVF